MTSNTMGVPLKLTSYPLETLLSGGVLNSKIYQKVPDHMLGQNAKAYLSIFWNQFVRGGGVYFWTPRILSCYALNKNL